MSHNAIPCLVSLFLVASLEAAVITSGVVRYKIVAVRPMPYKKLSEATPICAHFCLPVSKWGTQLQHTVRYPSHSQHRLLQHTVFSSKLCWNFSVMFDELIIFMPVYSVSAVLVQMLQDRSLMSTFPSLKYFTQCRVACAPADVCKDANKTDWQICSEIVLYTRNLTTSWWCNEASSDSQFVAVVGLYILVHMHCACISG
jgi:hypothetical protein